MVITKNTRESTHLYQVLAITQHTSKSYVHACMLLVLYCMFVIIVVFIVLLFCHALAEEATESKGGHFAKLKWFSIAKITILWRGLKFKRGHGPPGPPISAAHGLLCMYLLYWALLKTSLLPNAVFPLNH